MIDNNAYDAMAIINDRRVVIEVHAGEYIVTVFDDPILETFSISDEVNFETRLVTVDDLVECGLNLLRYHETHIAVMIISKIHRYIINRPMRYYDHDVEKVV